MVTVTKPRRLSSKTPHTVSVTDLKLHTGRLLRSVARGRTLTVTHRRKALARVMPLGAEGGHPGPDDPFFRLVECAEPMGVLNNEQIDQAIYGL